jgi:UDP-glucose:(heptosyl)LPS alpha-1,3-glucosyltransferase
MKIALAIENFSLHGGGAEAYAVLLARRLVSEGWEVHLFGYRWDNDPGAAVFHRIAELPRWIPPSVRIFHFALAHRKLVSQENFDVILGFGNTIAMNVYQSHGGVHYLSNVRKLAAVRNSAARLLKGAFVFLTPKYHARAWIEAAAFRSKERPVMVAISEMVRKDMAEYFRIDPNEIGLVYNGIDTGRFSEVAEGVRRDLRDRLGIGPEVAFLFMAYDFRKKGVRYLVEAAAKLRDRVGPAAFRVVVVGGAPSPTLRSLVRRLNLRRIVTFCGPTREPETMYHACDVFILPTFYDACSLVVFEAMAAGLPAITTAFNGAAGIITSGIDGIVFNDPSDIEQIATAMVRFLDPGFLHAASVAAREKASSYTLENNHRQMIEIFLEAANKHKAGVMNQERA